MDLHTIESVARPGRRSELPAWQAGDVFLAGGTWLFSEPQAEARRLVDLTALGWEPVRVGEAGLHVAATCTIARLVRTEFPAAWRGAALVEQCGLALLGSFKIWNCATVGGNLCLALPAGPFIAMGVALEGIATVWTPEGGERHLPILDFVTGPGETALRPGELLRGIDFPAATLRARTAFRRMSLSPNGRSGALVIGVAGEGGFLKLTVTASTRRPVRIVVSSAIRREELRTALDAAIGPEGWYDDPHGRPAWRAHVTRRLAEEIRIELSETAT